MHDIRRDEALFVQLYERDLAGPDVLFDKVRDAIVDAAKGMNVAATAARTLAAWLKIQPAGAVADEALTDRVVTRATAVLHVAAPHREARQVPPARHFAQLHRRTAVKQTSAGGI